MLKKHKEEDFTQLYYQGLGRGGYLSPGTLGGLIFASFIFVFIMDLVLLFGTKGNSNINESYWNPVVMGEMILLVVHFLFMLLFVSEKIAYRFQKLGAFLASLATLRLGLGFFPIHFLIWDDRDMPFEMLYFTAAIL